MLNPFFEDLFVDSSGTTIDDHIAPNSSTYAPNFADSLVIQPSGDLVQAVGNAVTAPNSTTPPVDYYAVEVDIYVASLTNNTQVQQLMYFQGGANKYNVALESEFGTFVTIGGNSTTTGGGYSAITGVTATNTYTVCGYFYPDAVSGIDLVGFIKGPGIVTPVVLTAKDSAAWAGKGLAGIVMDQPVNNSTEGFVIQAVRAYPLLQITPTSGTAVDLGSAIPLLVDQYAIQNTLTATLTGLGTLSVGSPGAVTSGVPFSYTGPSSGSGDWSVTVTDSVTGQSVSCAGTYGPSGGGGGVFNPIGCSFIRGSGGGGVFNPIGCSFIRGI
jgi:hypothetical protein